MVKRYYRRRYRKKLMSRYFKTKLSCIDRVILDDNDIKLASTNGVNRNIRAYLTSCNEWGYLTKIFYSFKLTGILIETVPGVIATAVDSVPVFGGTYQLALLPMGSDSNSPALADANASLVLSPTQSQRKYISFTGSLNGWLDIASIENNLVALLTVAATALPQNTGLVWSIKLTFYVTFKTPK
ncbi:MAG: hypothetical protein [Circular genetic element sp.]|nr:MAG: hypothetical protein [Circular genetic element sp.]